MGLAYTYQEMYVFPQSTLELLEEEKSLDPHQRQIFIYFLLESADKVWRYPGNRQANMTNNHFAAVQRQNTWY